MANTQNDNPSQPEAPKPTTAYFMQGLRERVQQFDFLDVSYKGGTDYKNAEDASGQPMLIEHENEFSGGDSSSLFDQMKRNEAGGNHQHNRYFRRKRIASYENHVKPIVDKIASYALRNAPKRSEKITDDIERIDLSEHISTILCMGLKLTESWIGWDTLGIPVELEVPQSVVNEIDPIHKGRAYLITLDPRDIVDFEVDPDDNDRVTRVVFREVQELKGTLTTKPQKRIGYKEWTDSEWVQYELADQQAKESFDHTKVIEVARGYHDFGRCPWIRYAPPFPIADIAELNRSLFNVNSLLDEELYNCTFTQKWITGERPDAIKDSESGSGNTLVIPNEQAKVGVFGAITGQAVSLMNRMDSLRDAIYMIVSMENTSTKNVAETAEKKKRDLESLYTMLVQIIRSIEKVENDLLVGMEIIEVDDNGNPDADARTTYDQKCDVNSIEDLQMQLEQLGNMPYVSPTLKRHLSTQMTQKLDPFGDHEMYAQEIDGLIASDKTFLEGIELMISNGTYTPELIADLFGVPDDSVDDFIAMLVGHAAKEEEANNANPFGENDEEGEEDEDAEVVDDEEDSGDDNPFPPTDKAEE